MRHLKVLTLLGLFCLTLATPSALLAEESSKEELLEADLATLVDLARQSFEAEDYEAAVDRLVLANRLEPNSRLLINIARSHNRAGNCLQALAYYQAFLRHPQAESALFESVETAIDEIQPDCDADPASRGARLILESSPALAAIYLNDELVGTTPMELIALPGGTHSLRMERDGYEPYTQNITIAARRDLTVEATLREVPVAQETIQPPVAPPSAEAGFSPNPIALGLIAGGVVLIGVGAYTDLVAIPSIDVERRSIGEANPNDPRIAELTRQRQSRSILAISAYLGGSALALGGGIWLLVDYLGASDDGALGWHVAPDISPDRAGALIQRRF